MNLRTLGITIGILVLAVLGMGLYGLHLRNQALELEQRANSARRVAPPASGPTESIIVYSPNDTRGTLVRSKLNANLPTESSQRAREIVRLVINSWQEKNSQHPISPAADVNEVFLLNNNKTAVVDVNSAFADEHRSGILVEELTLASLTRTLGANIPGLAQVRFIVDGHPRETLAGHADLTDFYSTTLDWPTE